MFINYLILAIIQGFTEPIPISSSGHLIIFKKLLNSGVLNDLNFEIILNFGSLVAIFLYFRKDIIKLIKEFFIYIKTEDKKYFRSFKYCILLIIGTIPAGIIGLLFKDKIEELLSSVKVVGVALVVTAICLFIIRNMKGNKEDKDITYKDALIIGLFQAVALLPGISRSGATIVGGMSRKLTREAAFKFSFLLYIPISLASMLSGVKDIIKTGLDTNLLLIYLVCMVVSGIITYLTTIWFKNIVKNGKLIYFVFYCLIVGSLVIIFL